MSLFANAQTISLRINPNIVLPRDHKESITLIGSINNFLLSAQKSNEENKFVFDDEKIATFILLDEIKGIEKNEKFKDDFFYKPYLTNVVLLKDNNYLVQVSYIGISENSSFLRASFEFIAHKNNKSFAFSSPLTRNTKSWKIEKVGNNTFHYQNSINKEKTKEFNKLASSFDKKLKSENKITDYYLCDNIIEIQKLIGVNYKHDYNGLTESTWSSSYINRNLILSGTNNSTFKSFDTHDLFHDRLSLVISRSSVNKPVDEGCAYLYGGSWGLTWEEIFEEFKNQVASNKSTDWTKVKETTVSFYTRGYPNSADYIVNALLVKKIEKEKGFDGVWELLNIGPYEKSNANYYATLEKLTGITKANYNDQIWELIINEE